MQTSIGFASVVSCVLITASAAGAEPLKEFLEKQAVSVVPGMLEFYKELHAHPELSMREVETARKFAEKIRSLGCEVATGVGELGVVGVLCNGSGPTVLVRAELDALPVEEKTGLPYASKVKTTDDQGREVPVMHACGHDMHMAVTAGVTAMLARNKDRWAGTLLVVGQPAEERIGGAKRMLADGLYRRFPKPDYCLAVHVSSELPTGTVGVGEGAVCASVDTLDMTVRGVGGHGAFPDKAKDPIVLAAQIILGLQTIVSRDREPIDPVVVTVGSIHGGTKHNIIPDEVKLQLTVRTFNDETRDRTLEAIGRVARGQAMAAGMPADRMPVITIVDEQTPSVYNDPPLAQRVSRVLGTVIGPDNVRPRRPMAGGDDFACYGRTAEKIPICVFNIGSIDPERTAESQRTGKPLPWLHSSLFYPAAEATLRGGVTSLGAAVLDLMGKEKK